MTRIAATLCVAFLLAVVGRGPAVAAGCGAEATQSELGACAAAAHKRADEALNATYRAITARLKDDAETKQALVAAQRAWLAFRDAQCAFVGTGSEGGSIQPMIVSNCLAELTRRRDGELKAFLHCGEGDVACPVPPAE